MAAAVSRLRELGHHAAGNRVEVQRLTALGQFGAAGARQGQQVGQHLTGAQRIALEPHQQGFALRFGDGPAQRTRLQRDRGQGRAQLVGQLIAQVPLALEHGMVAPGQGVDRVRHRAQLLLRVGVGQRRGLTNVERIDIARECIQGLESAANGQAQRERGEGQKPEAGLDHLPGNVLGQVVALAHTEQHHHFFLVRGSVPARKGAPNRGRVAELQGFKTLHRRERRQRRVPAAREHATARVPHHHAERTLVVMALEVGATRRIHPRAQGWLRRRVLHQLQQRHACEVAVGQLVGLVNAGRIARHHKTRPDDHQRAQGPSDQVQGQGLRFDHGRSSGTK